MNKPDYFLIVPVAILVLLGLLIIASVSASLSLAKFGSPTFYLFHYLIYGLIPGILLGFVAYKIPLSFLRKWSPILLLINLFLLILIFVPKIGMTLGGARSWINFFGLFSFQPSEFNCFFNSFSFSQPTFNLTARHWHFRHYYCFSCFCLFFGWHSLKAYFYHWFSSYSRLSSLNSGGSIPFSQNLSFYQSKH